MTDTHDPTLVMQEDVVNALNDIAEEAPELMEYILTCYPPELMIYISPKIKKRWEDANVQGVEKDNN